MFGELGPRTPAFVAKRHREIVQKGRAGPGPRPVYYEDFRAGPEHLPSRPVRGPGQAGPFVRLLGSFSQHKGLFFAPFWLRPASFGPDVWCILNENSLSLKLLGVLVTPVPCVPGS